MSYGKDSTHTDKIAASMSQQMGNARRLGGGGKNGPPLWANQYRPTETGVDEIRLVPGHYTITRINENDVPYTEEVPWWECTEHFHAILKKSAICSGGIFRHHRTKKEPCAGCEIFWADWRERDEIKQATGKKVTSPNRVSRSDRFIFHVLDLGYFFKGPDVDERGVPKTDGSGKAYTKWHKYDGSPLHQHLHAQVVKEEDRRWGRLLEWSMGREHFGVLAKYAEELGKNCASCGTADSIRPQRWLCPTCHTDMFDPASLLIPQQQLQELLSRPSLCRNCQHTGYPQEILACSACPAPRRASIFDVNFKLCAQKDPNANSRTLVVMAVSPPCGIADAYTDLLQKLPNLVERYTPTPYQAQMTLFQQGGPRDGQQQQPPAQQPQPPAATYGQQPQPGQFAPQHPQHPQQPPAPQYHQQYQQPAQAQPGFTASQQAPLATPPGQAPQQAGQTVGQQSGWGSNQ